MIFRKINILYIVSILAMLNSCDKSEFFQKTSKFELRQMVQTETVEKMTKGSYFLIYASYESSEKKENYVKVMAKVEGRYKIISIPLGKLRIVINDSLRVPNLQLEYFMGTPLSDEEITNEMTAYINSRDIVYVISCPEKYLPEKILPVEL